MKLPVKRVEQRLTAIKLNFIRLFLLLIVVGSLTFVLWPSLIRASNDIYTVDLSGLTPSTGSPRSSVDTDSSNTVFWVGGSGNWSGNGGYHWSSTSGGTVSPANQPTSTKSYFSALSPGLTLVSTAKLRHSLTTMK